MTNLIVRGLVAAMLVFAAACGASDKSPDSEAAEELAADIDGEESADDAAVANEDATEEELESFGEDEVAAEDKSFDETAPPDAPIVDAPLVENTSPTPAPTEAVAATPVPVSSGVQNKVTEINYLSSVNGGTVEIKTTSPAVYTVRPNPSTNQFVVEIQQASLVDSLKRPFIMKDFDGAFGAINAYQHTNGSTTRIVVQMKGSGEPFVSQQGNSLLVVAADVAPAITPTAAVSPEKKEAVAEPDPADVASYDVASAAQSEKILSAQTLDEFLTGSGRFFGRPISIQTNGANVRDVISFIAEESGVNLVLADDVDGKVSVKLRQVPWDQALVIVMRSRGLGYVRQGNVLRITKLATLQAEATAAKDIVDSQKKLTPIKVKVLPVSYASVTELATQVKPFLSSDRGQVVADVRTSTVIITDTADVLNRVERLVRELDIPPAQVMIEGKIVEASETFTRSIGVNWGFGGAAVELSPGGGVNGTPIVGSASFSSANGGGGNSLLNLQVGTLDILGSLDASLSLAQTDNLVRIISSPRIVTMNKEKAQISQKGETITIQTSVVGGTNPTTTTTAVRSPVELKLEVTPQITNEGSVVLDVQVLRQFVGAKVDEITQARPVNSREAKTKVLVPNGQTAVIGGIYQSDETENEAGTPVLKDIPVLGWLFKRKSQERVKNELLLFLTPRILNAKDQSVTN
jgi:type IV pilus assembly protein PilQ